MRLAIEYHAVIGAGRIGRHVAEADVFRDFLGGPVQGVTEAAASAALEGVDVSGVEGEGVDLAVGGRDRRTIGALDEDAVSEGGLTTFDAPGGALGALDLGVEIDRGEGLGGPV